jgi:hypothetical protein
MLLLEEYISNFTCARYYFFYVEFNHLNVNQSLAGQTLQSVYKRTYSHIKSHMEFEYV